MLNSGFSSMEMCGFLKVKTLLVIVWGKGNCE